MTSSMSTAASSSKVTSSMTLPNELWLPIFEYLPSRSLRNVVLTSKKFHAVAIRLLYKHLILTSPTSFVTARSVLSSIQPSPHALLLSISPFARNVEQLQEAVAVVSFDGLKPITVNVNDNRQSTRSLFSEIKDAYRPSLVADTTLYNTLLSQVTSFTFLRQLAISTPIVHDFPHLRDLAVVHCTVPFVRAPPDIDHTSLKIETLTLLDIRATSRSDDDDMNLPRTRLRLLAKASTLRTLTYDHTVWVHRAFTSSSPSPPLTALDVKFPVQKDRPRVPLGFIPFLETLSSLRTLILRNHVPALSLSSSALPALCAISAPFSTITSLCSGRSIVKLDIRDEAVLTPLYKAFAEVHSDLSMVQELSLFVGDWDDELMLAIVAHFPNLTKLQVRYARGGPSEDTIIGMGSRTLYTLPHLVSVHIFCIPLPPPPQNFLETNNLDDDTAYGAPGIDDTYFQSMHDIDLDTDTSLEQDNSEDYYGVPYRCRARNPHNLLPAIYQGTDMDLDVDIDMDAYTVTVYCCHGTPVGLPCQGCTVAEHQKHLDQFADNNHDFEPGFEEPQVSETEPFDDYTRELVIAWNRACPGLRTVQLHPGWVWRRADPADSWVARQCESGIFGDVFESPPCHARSLADIIKNAESKARDTGYQ
ncbi:hypothetical protein DFJ58DRAFT_823704 [Suillus subalutaceus]|uniref:uncharacterized protein n=1 Tax=Suillus subalutaceus TaxID=48586 RepID=UPI001B85CA8C|nr:uncharacterized protein DFJ58DRAFT_823704 [Suillus subalutaceus]KAG1831907.1 hypothetical protein DFJ58DRAFT_823704 [Suillus subalutaceus]